MFPRKSRQPEPKMSELELDDSELDGLLNSVSPEAHQGASLQDSRPLDQFIGLPYNSGLLKMADSTRRSENPQVELVSNDAAERPNMGIELIRPLPQDQERARGSSLHHASVPVGMSPQMGQNSSWGVEEPSTLEQIQQRLDFVQRHGPQTRSTTVTEGAELGASLQEHIARVNAESNPRLGGSQVPVFKSDPQASGSMMGQGGAQVANKAASQEDMWAELSKTAAKRPAAQPAQAAPQVEWSVYRDDAKLQPLVLELNQVMETSDWIAWEYETIVQSLVRKGCDATRISPIVRDKIGAIKLILNSDAFFTNVRAFEKVCVVLGHRQADYGRIQTVTVAEMAAAVLLVSSMRDAAEWSSDVCAFVAASAWDQGYVALPEMLRFASADLMNVCLRGAGEGAPELIAQSEEVLGAMDQAFAQGEEAVLDLLLELPEHLSIQCLRYARLNEYLELQLEGFEGAGQA